MVWTYVENKASHMEGRPFTNRGAFQNGIPGNIYPV